tara:strand:- start:787 stop:996 length:210 start_codon:yes stop_codon:yes gene_type:complete
MFLAIFTSKTSYLTHDIVYMPMDVVQLSYFITHGVNNLSQRSTFFRVFLYRKSVLMSTQVMGKWSSERL